MTSPTCSNTSSHRTKSAHHLGAAHCPQAPAHARQRTAMLLAACAAIGTMLAAPPARAYVCITVRLPDRKPDRSEWDLPFVDNPDPYVVVNGRSYRSK